MLFFIMFSLIFFVSPRGPWDGNLTDPPHFSFLISHFSSLTSHLSLLIFHFPSLTSHLSLLISHFPSPHLSLLISHFSSLISHFSSLTSQLSLLISHFSTLTSHLSLLISHFGLDLVDKYVIQTCLDFLELQDARAAVDQLLKEKLRIRIVG